MSEGALRMELPSARARRLETREPRRLREGLERCLEWPVGRWKSRRKRVGRLLKDAEAVMRRGEALKALSDRQLQLRIEHFREEWPADVSRLASGLILDGFAAVAEAASRTLGQRPYRAQIVGALILRQGGLSEMVTGEGKTLTLALAAVLAAWSGQPCHILTANDYLAERDHLQMGPLYRFCGLSVSSVTAAMEASQRMRHYRADVVYTTSRELVADYLRDRLRRDRSGSDARPGLQILLDVGSGNLVTVLNGVHHVFLDEADHLLIDEAGTPLIISAARRDPVFEQACREAYEWSMDLQPGVDYSIDYEVRDIQLTPSGEERLGRDWCPRSPLLAPGRWRSEWVSQALKARELFHRGQHYEVEEGCVVIIDEGTGRSMQNRSWGQGLHQMVELKENVTLTPPTVTVASISFQRFFRQAPRLAGVTGTAWENRDEIWRVYGLPVLRVPTHRPSRRKIEPLRVYRDSEIRWSEAARMIDDYHKQGCPVLAGTRSVAASERLSWELTGRGLPHQMLNAVHHRHEAKVIAQAGLPGTITVATNMAGRGTDIKISDEVGAKGGLVVVATELHQSRRVDRQLYGRCGRQGDPGLVIQLASWDDELTRRFLPGWMRWLGRQFTERDSASNGPLAGVFFRFAQFNASFRAARARIQVLRRDRWMDETIG